MPDLYAFLSYARTDNAFADRLSRDLRQAGVKIWRDTDCILPGTHWQKEIESALTKATALLYVSSINTPKSEWMMFELQAFIRQHSGPVIPIILDAEGVSNLPDPLKQYQWVDFRESYDLGLQALLQGLPSRLKLPRPLEQKYPISKGYVFISYAEEDSSFVAEIRSFLKTKGYAYWDYQESDRDYHRQYFLELEERIQGASATFTILSPAWKRSEWAIREYYFSNDVGTPVFLLKINELGPTLPIAGRPFIDFTKNRENGFNKLARELERKGM